MRFVVITTRHGVQHGQVDNDSRDIGEALSRRTDKGWILLPVKGPITTMIREEDISVAALVERSELAVPAGTPRIAVPRA